MGQGPAAVAPTDPAIPPLADFYRTPLPLPVLPSADPMPTSGAPSLVEVRGQPGQYSYYVNGQPVVFHGVGYNVAYRLWGWSCEARARRYDRDFSAIKAAGFDTLLGWDEGEFDDLTLDKAQKYGLGVVFPYNFAPEGDWESLAYRQGQSERVITLVRRYAHHPALRMWGLGDEVVLAIGDPSSPRARAFADFFADLAQVVHQLDPSHPILYRDGEDSYYAPIRDALRARGIEQPWLVYGTNVFTLRGMHSVLDGWLRDDFRVPLLVSEFGLDQYPPADRPEGLVAMWDIIRQHDAYVLGGAIYAWTTAGIELTDTQYGLVDSDGQPIDGALRALSARLAWDWT